MSYSGIALLMFLENVFPPIPSELIMPLAGYAAASGNLDPVLVVLSGSAGSLAGTTFWYFAGRFFSKHRLMRFARRHGRLLTLSPKDIERANCWFERQSAIAVTFGRLVPTVRTLISVPAGMFRMSFPRFLVFSAIGTVAWTAALTAAGYALGRNYARVASLLNPVATGITVLIVAVYLYRVITWSPTDPLTATGADSDGSPKSVG